MTLVPRPVGRVLVAGAPMVGASRPTHLEAAGIAAPAGGPASWGQIRR